MKLWIFSDLHMDHGAFDLEPPADADVAVIAGDVVNDEFLVRLSERLPVVFVAGNHEHYGHVYSERLAALLSLSSDRLHVLENDAVTIDGVRFLGCTLWTDYNRGDPAAMHRARYSLNDHRFIKWQKEPWQRFRPEEAMKIHQKSRAYLAANVLPGDVVVTHHGPHENSVHEKYAGDILNHAYYSDLSAEIEEWRPKLWVHGHTHCSFDYGIGRTRVVCNPHGYPGENSEFDPALVIGI